MEKEESIRRLEDVLQNWRGLKVKSRVEEIEFKLSRMRETRPEEFLRKGKLAEQLDREWEEKKEKK